MILFSLIDEYLSLLCESCEFHSAHLLVFAPAGEKQIKIIDRTHFAGKYKGDRRDISSAQIPFLFHEDCRKRDIDSGIGDERKFSIAESAQIEMQFKSIPCREGWDLSSSGQLEWSFKGAVNGLAAELRVSCNRITGGSIIHSLYLAERFLDLLESVISVAGIEHTFDNKDLHCASSLEKKYSSKNFNPPLYGGSQVIKVLKSQIKNVASSSIPVLIEGENGTGKEIVARNIHHLRPGRPGPLVIINCMELPPSLLQSELFGHVKGSFTGAMNDRKGLIESAEGGTFFLDEIGEMPLHLQAALLRVIQEKEIRRVGESQRRVVDVRFVFATNRDLADFVKRGKFREDLYYRIKGVRIHLPPLRKRKEDIIILTKLFLDSSSRKLSRKVPRISAGAARELLAYDWPGNVRELKNEIERVMALYPDIPVIFPDMFSSAIRNDRFDLRGGLDPEGETLPEAVRRLELKMIEKTLKHFSGNRTRSAAVLGITRQGLLKKMKRYELAETVF
ncbi:MAG: sigma-54-dependent Fis family transcriptional regulator [Candidatus Krumholzibacteriota bacterium]|nr:sigma-54-dependent Fis family transcriptional regulator [Candidatus Krumholzibacteriota bacterium]